MICVIFSFCVILFFPFCFDYIIFWSCCHLLAACCLLLDAVKKLLAAGQIRWRQGPVILSEPGQQIIVFNFFHIILSKSYILQDAAGVKRLLLEACRLSQDLVAQDPAVVLNEGQTILDRR